MYRLKLNLTQFHQNMSRIQMKREPSLGGGCKNSGHKFIYPGNSKACYHLHSDNLELVTVIKCVSAVGILAPTSFVLKKGKRPYVNDIPDGKVGLWVNFMFYFDNWPWFDCIRVAFSPTGWTDGELCEQWFLKTFIPTAESCCVSDKPIILNYNRHASHETPVMQRAAFEHNIILLAFPSKTTHKTQPLDVGVFGTV